MVAKNEPGLEYLETKPVASCCHYWIIQCALGPVSDGKCQNCGEVRQFNNVVSYERKKLQ